jgi:hypothetical protein
MLKILFIALSFYQVAIAKDEAKQELPDTSPVVSIKTDLNEAGIAPVYNQVDNSSEKTLTFSWGKLYYTSVTANDDHNRSTSPQTTLQLRYECKNSKRKPTTETSKKMEFCGYAKSEVDKTQKAFLIKEMRQEPDNKKKTDAEMEALYNAEFNSRIAFPDKNIMESKKGTAIEVLVREQAHPTGECEDKVTTLTFPIDCK